jgi:fumarylacetoacetase
MRLVEQPFSLKHLPYGIVDFGEEHPHLAVRLGDQAVSLEVLRRAELLSQLSARETRGRSLNALLALPRQAHLDLRARLTEALQAQEHLDARGATLDLAPYPQDDPRVLIPIDPGDYVDFYCSRHHAYRVGCLFRSPQEALPEQYFHLPIGYHGRCSTLLVSGNPVTRPNGITTGPTFGASERLDYELEMAYLLRPCQHPLSPDQAVERIFGVLLLNDWSARDIQAYEYRPLGPFLGKSFATSVGAWVTPWEALQNWSLPNTDSDHPVLPHLRESGAHHLELPLWGHLHAPDGDAEICLTDLKHLAWSPAQMLAHLTSNGTLVRAGDLIASGTVSGPQTGAEACLLERTDGGKQPFQLGQAGRERRFFHDGDTVTLLGGHPGVGLAPCRAKVLPARPQ